MPPMWIERWPLQKRAFLCLAPTDPDRRLAMLNRILEIYNRRDNEIAEAVSDEMGAPLKFAREAQAWAGQVHLEAAIKALSGLEFSFQRGSSRIVREAIGVVGLITPWNWPL